MCDVCFKFDENRTKTFPGELFASYRKSRSLNPFLVVNLRLEVELMYLLRMHTAQTLSSQKSSNMVSCRAPEIGQTPSPSSLKRYLVLCTTDTDDVALLGLQVAAL